MPADLPPAVPNLTDTAAAVVDTVDGDLAHADVRVGDECDPLLDVATDVTLDADHDGEGGDLGADVALEG